jgi:hypothetical protein
MDGEDVLPADKKLESPVEQTGRMICFNISLISSRAGLAAATVL